jgi:hypothetical protein
MGYLRKRETAGRDPGQVGVSVYDPAELDAWGALLEFLLCETFPDGSRRQTGTLLLFSDEGRLKGCLCDREQSIVGFVSGTSLMQVLRDVEQQLRDDRVDWRAQRGNGRKHSK